MKTKRFDKKMVLNKKTIAHLENRVMNVVQGGATITCTLFSNLFIIDVIILKVPVPFFIVDGISISFASICEYSD